MGADDGAAELELGRADGVFEGGGVKGLAFVGALAAAEEELGIHEWVNVAGTSAGAIVASLLVAGFTPAELRTYVGGIDYNRFADYGPGGRILGGLRNALRRRGLVRGEYLKEWLRERLAESPLRDADATFADVRRDDLPPGLSADEIEMVGYRLRVIASDVSEGRMLVLPHDIALYEDDDGRPLRPEDLRIVDAVRMSMSFPFFFDPVVLRKDGNEHLIVDGGLLSNYPIWLFDTPKPIKRHTWGFRLHPGVGDYIPPYQTIKRPLWEPPLARAMLHATMTAWDERLELSSAVRTISIPTGSVKTLDFDLSDSDRHALYAGGHDVARDFFRSLPEYRNQHGQTAPVPPSAQR
jgi:NTE family protein